ncbi:MAG TPA: hypothetical protein PLW61_03450 [Caldisericia bacterium]|mgnify:CR=1 FL=1|nr:hypothetical protein [Caldisericia bacterium]HQL67439.1 hypothetical protein [Caldisericia bacterium]
MEKKIIYLKIGNEEFNHLLDEIDDIWMPTDEQPYTDIKFKNGEAWYTTAPVLVGVKYIEVKEDK